jgi:hypothetical protein
MNTIIGTNWTLDYIIANGKLVGTKFRGKCSGMKEAFKALEEILAIEVAKVA